MSTEPHWDGTLAVQGIPNRTATFAGEPQDVTGARLAAEGFLRELARVTPPSAPECWHDILLVVDELAANAVQFAPGPFRLLLRRTFDGVHIALHDTSTTEPRPRPFDPEGGGGGIGWHLIHTLCDQVSVVTQEDGKDVHVFLPW